MRRKSSKRMSREGSSRGSSPTPRAVSVPVSPSSVHERLAKQGENPLKRLGDHRRHGEVPIVGGNSQVLPDRASNYSVPGLRPGGQSPIAKKRGGKGKDTRRGGIVNERRRFTHSNDSALAGSEDVSSTPLATSVTRHQGSVESGDGPLGASQSSLVPPTPLTSGLLGSEATAALLSHLADLRSLCNRQRDTGRSLRGALARKQGELDSTTSDLAWLRSELAFITGDVLGALQHKPTASTVFRTLSERVRCKLGAEAAGIYVDIGGGRLWLIPTSGPTNSTTAGGGEDVCLARGEGAVGLVAMGGGVSAGVVGGTSGQSGGVLGWGENSGFGGRSEGGPCSRGYSSGNGGGEELGYEMQVHLFNDGLEEFDDGMSVEAALVRASRARTCWSRGEVGREVEVEVQSDGSPAGGIVQNMLIARLCQEDSAVIDPEASSGSNSYGGSSQPWPDRPLIVIQALNKVFAPGHFTEGDARAVQALAPAAAAAARLILALRMMEEDSGPQDRSKGPGGRSCDECAGYVLPETASQQLLRDSSSPHQQQHSLTSPETLVRESLRCAREGLGADRARLLLLDCAAGQLRLWHEDMCAPQSWEEGLGEGGDGYQGVGKPEGDWEKEGGVTTAAGTGEPAGSRRGEAKDQSGLDSAAWPRRSPAADVRVPADSGLEGIALATGRTVRSEDALTDTLFDRKLDLHVGFLTRSLLCAPLKVPDGDSGPDVGDADGGGQGGRCVSGMVGTVLGVLQFAIGRGPGDRREMSSWGDGVGGCLGKRAFTAEDEPLAERFAGEVAGLLAHVLDQARQVRQRASVSGGDCGVQAIPPEGSNGEGADGGGKNHDVESATIPSLPMQELQSQLNPSPTQKIQRGDVGRNVASMGPNANMSSSHSNKSSEILGVGNSHERTQGALASSSATTVAHGLIGEAIEASLASSAGTVDMPRDIAASHLSLSGGGGNKQGNGDSGNRGVGSDVGWGYSRVEHSLQQESQLYNLSLPIASTMDPMGSSNPSSMSVARKEDKLRQMGQVGGGEIKNVNTSSYGYAHEEAWSRALRVIEVCVGGLAADTATVAGKEAASVGTQTGGGSSGGSNFARLAGAIYALAVGLVPGCVSVSLSLLSNENGELVPVDTRGGVDGCIGRGGDSVGKWGDACARRAIRLGKVTAEQIRGLVEEGGGDTDGVNCHGSESLARDSESFEGACSDGWVLCIPLISPGGDAQGVLQLSISAAETSAPVSAPASVPAHRGGGGGGGGGTEGKAIKAEVGDRRKVDAMSQQVLSMEKNFPFVSLKVAQALAGCSGLALGWCRALDRAESEKVTAAELAVAAGREQGKQEVIMWHAAEAEKVSEENASRFVELTESRNALVRACLRSVMRRRGVRTSAACLIAWKEYTRLSRSADVFRSRVEVLKKARALQKWHETSIEWGLRKQRVALPVESFRDKVGWQRAQRAIAIWARAALQSRALAEGIVMGRREGAVRMVSAVSRRRWKESATQCRHHAFWKWRVFVATEKERVGSEEAGVLQEQERALAQEIATRLEKRGQGLADSLATVADKRRQELILRTALRCWRSHGLAFKRLSIAEHKVDVAGCQRMRSLGISALSVWRGHARRGRMVRSAVLQVVRVLQSQRRWALSCALSRWKLMVVITTHPAIADTAAASARVPNLEIVNSCTSSTGIEHSARRPHAGFATEPESNVLGQPLSGVVIEYRSLLANQQATIKVFAAWKGLIVHERSKQAALSHLQQSERRRCLARGLWGWRLGADRCAAGAEIAAAESVAAVATAKAKAEAVIATETKAHHMEELEHMKAKVLAQQQEGQRQIKQSDTLRVFLVWRHLTVLQRTKRATLFRLVLSENRRRLTYGLWSWRRGVDCLLAGEEIALAKAAVAATACEIEAKVTRTMETKMCSLKGALHARAETLEQQMKNQRQLQRDTLQVFSAWRRFAVLQRSRRLVLSRLLRDEKRRHLAHGLRVWQQGVNNRIMESEVSLAKALVTAAVEEEREAMRVAELEADHLQEEVIQTRAKTLELQTEGRLKDQLMETLKVFSAWRSLAVQGQLRKAALSRLVKDGRKHRLLARSLWNWRRGVYASIAESKIDEAECVAAAAVAEVAVALERKIELEGKICSLEEELTTNASRDETLQLQRDRQWQEPQRALKAFSAWKGVFALQRLKLAGLSRLVRRQQRRRLALGFSRWWREVHISVARSKIAAAEAVAEAATDELATGMEKAVEKEAVYLVELSRTRTEVSDLKRMAEEKLGVGTMWGDREGEGEMDRCAVLALAVARACHRRRERAAVLGALVTWHGATLSRRRGQMAGRHIAGLRLAHCLKKWFGIANKNCQLRQRRRRLGELTMGEEQGCPSSTPGQLFARRVAAATAVETWVEYSTWRRRCRMAADVAVRHAQTVRLQASTQYWAERRLFGTDAATKWQRALEMRKQRVKRFGLRRWHQLVLGAEVRAISKSRVGETEVVVGGRLLARLEGMANRVAEATTHRQAKLFMKKWRGRAIKAVCLQSTLGRAEAALVRRKEVAALRWWLALASRHHRHKRKLECASERAMLRSLRKGWWAWRENIILQHQRDNLPQGSGEQGMPLCPSDGREEVRKAEEEKRRYQHLLEVLVDTCAAPPPYPLGSGMKALGLESCRAAMTAFGLLSVALYELVGKEGVLSRVVAISSVIADSTWQHSSCNSGKEGGEAGEKESEGRGSLHVLGVDQGPPVQEVVGEGATGTAAQTAMPVCIEAVSCDHPQSASVFSHPDNQPSSPHATDVAVSDQSSSRRGFMKQEWNQQSMPLWSQQPQPHVLPDSPLNPYQATVLCVPVMLQTGAAQGPGDAEVVGVLRAVRSGPSSFSGDDARALAVFCGHLAVAMVAEHALGVVATAAVAADEHATHPAKQKVRGVVMCGPNQGKEHASEGNFQPVKEGLPQKVASGTLESEERVQEAVTATLGEVGVKTKVRSSKVCQLVCQRVNELARGTVTLALTQEAAFPLFSSVALPLSVGSPPSLAACQQDPYCNLWGMVAGPAAEALGCEGVSFWRPSMFNRRGGDWDGEVKKEWEVGIQSPLPSPPLEALLEAVTRGCAVGMKQAGITAGVERAGMRAGSWLCVPVVASVQPGQERRDPLVCCAVNKAEGRIFNKVDEALLNVIAALFGVAASWASWALRESPPPRQVLAPAVRELPFAAAADVPKSSLALRPTCSHDFISYTTPPPATADAFLGEVHSSMAQFGGIQDSSSSYSAGTTNNDGTVCEEATGGCPPATTPWEDNSDRLSHLTHEVAKEPTLTKAHQQNPQQGNLVVAGYPLPSMSSPLRQGGINGEAINRHSNDHHSSSCHIGVLAETGGLLPLVPSQQEDNGKIDVRGADHPTPAHRRTGIASGGLRRRIGGQRRMPEDVQDLGRIRELLSRLKGVTAELQVEKRRRRGVEQSLAEALHNSTVYINGSGKRIDRSAKGAMTVDEVEMLRRENAKLKRKLHGLSELMQMEERATRIGLLPLSAPNEGTAAL